MELTLYTLRTIAYAIVEPSHFLVLILLGFIFYGKNKKIAMIQRITIGESLNSPLELTLSQLVIGILAGAIGSVILNNIGIVFNENSGIEILLMISLMVLFFKKRFIEFAYTGAILGILGIVFKYLSSSFGLPSYLNVNICILMTFVGVMYFIQGFLIMVDGGRGAIPVFSNIDNKIVGGYAFSRCWPMPIAIFFAMVGSNISSVATGSIATPDWWPIINKVNTLALLVTTVIVSMPVYGIVNYKAVTFTKDKNKKPIYSGMQMLIFGISVMVIAQVAQMGLIGELGVIIYVPLVYEVILRMDKILEKKGKYLYVSDAEGVAVLEVAPTSSAYKVGIRRGDRVLQVNNKDVCEEVDVFKAIKDSLFNVHIRVKKVSGDIKDYNVKIENKRTGILLVPKMVNIEDVIKIERDEIK